MASSLLYQTLLYQTVRQLSIYYWRYKASSLLPTRKDVIGENYIKRFYWKKNYISFMEPFSSTIGECFILYLFYYWLIFLKMAKILLFLM
jgi:hypothetical protein